MFSDDQLLAVAEVLGDTADGLTGSQIASLLAACDIDDPGPITKRQRILVAPQYRQRRDKSGKQRRQLHRAGHGSGEIPGSGGHMPERDYLPRVYQDLRAEHPGIAEAYDRLGDEGRRAGPLEEREQRLVKLGIAVGLSSEGAVRSHVRRGLADGLTRAELLHAIVIAVPTAGFPATAAAYRWACQVLDHETDAPS